MKSGIRALIVSVALFFLWGTILTGPFRYFGYAFRDLFVWTADALHLPAALSGFIITLLLALSVIVLIIISAGKFPQYMAGMCALLSTLYYLITCLMNRSFDSLSFTVVLGLALALLFLIFQSDKASLWLADAYIFSIPVLLFVELVLTPLYATFKSFPRVFPFLFPIPAESFATRIGNLFEVPMLIWSVFLFALMLIPVLYLTNNRGKN